MKHSTRTHGQDALSLAIALALAAAVIPAGAAAQQATTTGSQDATTLDSVQVTGYRYAIEKSLEQKRDANAVVEVITAEDVGKFPDKNVADALQRVPGVVITRSGGEGKSVSVRGLAPDLTLTQLNGNFVASSETNNEATRSFNYTLLPSNMLSSAELFKSPEARIDEGGIGGTVILHTRRPLDMESNSGYVNLEGTTSDTSHDIDPQVSALYSWHSKDERFGVLVGVTQQKRTTRTMEASTEDYQWYGNGTTARCQRQRAGAGWHPLLVGPVRLQQPDRQELQRVLHADLGELRGEGREARAQGRAADLPVQAGRQRHDDGQLLPLRAAG
jgi:TonB-dependent receptor